jgi:cystathionine beta-lyase/cystathionine gamma-synthase
MIKSNRRIETKLIHAGEPEPRIRGAVSMPIFQSATFEYVGQDSYHDLKYIRLNNTPNHVVLHQKLAALENAEAAVVSSSGMAAITTTLLALLKPGDHFLAQDCLYGGTHDFFTKDFAALGISFDFIDGNDPDSWKRKFRLNTKAVYVETITNPLMQVADLKSLAVRIKHQNESALKIAKYLENHPTIKIVNYPGLESNPGHRRAQDLFDGYGGMLSFELKGGVEAAERLLQNTTLPISAPSLGGVESLITRPVTTSHSGMSPKELQSLGIADSLVRLSVGIEATEDLKADFDQALKV